MRESTAEIKTFDVGLDRRCSNRFHKKDYSGAEELSGFDSLVSGADHEPILTLLTTCITVLYRRVSEFLQIY